MPRHPEPILSVALSEVDIFRRRLRALVYIHPHKHPENVRPYTPKSASIKSSRKFVRFYPRISRQFVRMYQDVHT